MHRHYWMIWQNTRTAFIYLKLIQPKQWATINMGGGHSHNLLKTPGIHGIGRKLQVISVNGRKQKELIQESEYLRHQLMDEKINRQKEIMQAAIDAQEKERAHIGRELHDNVKQILSTAKVCLEYGRDNAASSTAYDAAGRRV